MPVLKKNKTSKDTSSKRKERQDIYNTSKWRKLRDAKLLNNPLCEVCLANNIITPADDIHHIISFLSTNDQLKRLELAYNYDNLQSICRKCHQKEHNRKTKT